MLLLEFTGNFGDALGNHGSSFLRRAFGICLGSCRNWRSTGSGTRLGLALLLGGSAAACSGGIGTTSRATCSWRSCGGHCRLRNNWSVNDHCRLRKNGCERPWFPVSWASHMNLDDMFFPSLMLGSPAWFANLIGRLVILRSELSLTPSTHIFQRGLKKIVLPPQQSQECIDIGNDLLPIVLGNIFSHMRNSLEEGLLLFVVEVLAFLVANGFKGLTD
mmetsp:Transcript_3704/g.8537  ORF Transcript_3704/g.8537 Transcript_3704/m.8537 type:complete len:218 (+) Transcript_3704:614-1267(+)